MNAAGPNTLHEAPLPENEAPAPEAPYSFRREIARKLIHFLGLLVPGIYYFVSRQTALTILAAICATGVLLDVVRHRHQKIMQVFDMCFGRVLRTRERDAQGRHLNAVTWFFLAAMVSVAVFPKYITIVSMVIALFGDAAAALVGRWLGRTRFYRNKSVEGSVGFILVASMAVVLLPKIGSRPAEYVIGVAAAFVGSVAELTPVEIVDDNFIVPLTIAGSMWLLYKLFLPGMDLHYGF